MRRERILVLDADSNAGLAVVQSLGAAGFECIVGAPQAVGPAFVSRWASQAVTYPDPLVAAAAFKQWIAAWLRENEVSLVIPVTECTLVPLHAMRDDDVVMAKTVMPSRATLDRVLDKERLRELAAEIGIPVPASTIVTTMDDLADDRIATWLSEGAAVVKPVRSKVWSGDTARELQAVVVRSRAELIEAVRERVGVVAVQVQQWVPGHGMGVVLLAESGRILMSMAHERLHELPLTGGGSSYRRSIEMPPDLAADAERLMRALDYDGVAMVEFRGDPATGRRWLVEINARFWGSLPLAIFAGADFPRALVEKVLHGKRPEAAPAKPNRYARQLDRDLHWLKQTIKRRGRFTREELTRPLGLSLLEWGRIATGRETWDGASLRDPAPLFFGLRDIAMQEVGTVAQRTARFAIKHAAKYQSVTRAERFHAARRVLVLCYGNICRSPYAERRLDMACATHEVRSAGFHQAEHRPTPEHVLRVATARGVDLSQHRSRLVTQHDLDWADLIVLMDQKNHEHLRRMNAASLSKTIWLGALDGGPIEVQDPYDLDAVAADHVLGRMDRCLEQLYGLAS